MIQLGIAGVICAGGIAFVYKTQTYSLIKSAIEKVAMRSFYVGYKELNPTIAAERRLGLLRNFQAQELNCLNDEGNEIDAIYLPAQESTGNVLVLCLNTTYQDHYPSHWEPFLKNGADILLWNPTKLGTVSYSKELSCLLKYLREKKPDQEIAVKTYCASTEPGISAVADQKDPKMHLIVDRGHGDVYKLARSFTIFADLSIVQAVLKENFDCEGISKIKEINGRILFITPEIDQIMDYGKKENLTRDLHCVKSDQALIELKEQDRWSHWTFTTYNDVLGFLAQWGIIRANFNQVQEAQFSSSQPVTYFKKRCVPALTKTCF
ncbi:MAG: hypothetical protein KBA81_03035 [Rhabdochlamydiaceae bacterium]|nr:hypothetical protein [Rhabdochlamydiaceae bacterium]